MEGSKRINSLDKNRKKPPSGGFFLCDNFFKGNSFVASRNEENYSFVNDRFSRNGIVAQSKGSA